MKAPTANKACLLPEPEEWDFRDVTEDECRLACCWEYSRSVYLSIPESDWWLITGEAGESTISWLAHYGEDLAEEFDFPSPWLSATKEHRNAMVERTLAPEVDVHPIDEILTELKDRLKHAVAHGLNPLKTIDEFLEGDGQFGANPLRSWPKPSVYLLRANFSMVGSEAVIRSLRSWARKEAKKLPGTKLAKAAATPFNCLKWLAAYRIEKVRRVDGITFDQVQASLTEYRRNFPARDSTDVLPIYASHGAWSKALAEAKKLLRQCRLHTKAFEKKIFRY